MEIGRVGGDVLLHPIDVVIEQIERLVALIDDFDPRRLAERHVPIAVVRIAPFDHDRQAVHHAPFAETTGEEIAERGFDGGLLAAVPVNPNQQLLVVRLARMFASLRRRFDEREPHVRDGAWAAGVENHVGSAGRHAKTVEIALLPECLLLSGSAFGSYLPFAPLRNVELARMLRPCSGFPSPSSKPCAKSDSWRNRRTNRTSNLGKAIRATEWRKTESGFCVGKDVSL